MNRALHHFKLPARQRGVTLIVGLIIVLLMGVLSLAAIRGSGLQENMAGNMRNKNLAFQAAESALRVGEGVVLAAGALPAFNGTNGLRQASDGAASVIYWSYSDWTANSKVTSLGMTGTAGLYAEPVYVVEEITKGIEKQSGLDGGAIDAEGRIDTIPYRVTVRAVGLTGDSVVVLQSHLKRIPD